eukprot:14411042-Ditylum_brightwellii.AAC.1
MAPPSQREQANMSVGVNPSDVVPLVVMVEGGNQSVMGSFVASKSKTALGKLEKWTCKQVSQATVSNGFSFNATFVCGEDQAYMCEVQQVGGVKVEGMDGAGINIEADVGEAEGCVGPISTDNTVLVRSEEEKEGNQEEFKLALPFACGVVKMVPEEDK